jgi:DmsE family decaheme c-type cytochrome
MLMRTLVTGLVTGITLMLGANAWAASEAPSAAPVYAAKGEQTCMKCHDQSPVVDILKTPHAVKGDARTPFANQACETCHGASPEHIASAAKVKGDQKPVSPAIRFNGPNASPVEQRNAVCLTCHQGAERINWQRGKHANNDIACNNCHTVHVTKDPVLVKATQPEKCFTCHAEQRADSFQYSHHPIREGKVVCADCHSVHGSQAGSEKGLLKEFTVNEVCYNCHADKRGPMLWEHQPVRERCTICHTPHGSAQPRLMVERLPYLCSTCHSATSNGSGGFFGGHQALPGAAPVGSIASAPQLLLQTRGCTNCHSQVHGSNSPNGAYFFR